MADPARLLLVEGPSDKRVIRNLRKCFRGGQSIPEFQIKATGDIDRLLSTIEPQIDVPDREALGILPDANDKPGHRWNEVVERIRRARPDLEAGSPAREGTIIASRPRIGIWLWPDNQSPGELEDFVAEMIPDDDPIWPLARRYIDGIPERDRKFAKKKTMRATVHAWLATRKTPGFIGSEIGQGDMRTDGPLVVQFTDWLRKLFA